MISLSTKERAGPLEESKMIKTDGNLKTLLRKVRNDLKLGDSSCVLLALSVATDNMIRAMHMFPEVQFIDVAANMNKQKRDMLFFPWLRRLQASASL